MKTTKTILIYLIAVLCFNTKTTKAQAYIYHPMVVDSANWEYSTIKNNNVFCDSGYKFEIYDDTIVNGINYKKLYSGGGNNNTFDLIRESNKKIYYRKNFGNFIFPEILLYDFSKNIGDTILTNKNGSSTVLDTLQSKIIQIDSILTKKGYRKRFIVKALNYGWAASCFMPERFWFIEEIGSPISFMYIELAGVGVYAPCEFSSYIIKKSTFKDTLVVPPPGCLHVGIDEKHETPLPKVVFTKNSTNDNTNYIVNINISGKGQLQIYNINGKLLQEVECNGNQKIKLSIPNLQNNILVWKLYENQTSSYISGKQIVNE